jgi:precorrin-8X/cobalt-precorrin-8 methylmutase
MRPPTPHRFETDGAAIYRASFAIIRTEAALARFSTAEEMVAVRMVHAAGMVELAPHIRFSTGAAEAARAALEAGAPILCDARMVSEGITRARLPAGNRIVCTLHDPEVPAIAARLGTTRSAAAVELWRPLLAGAVVAIGNAPTALFHLLNLLQDPLCPRPAAIVGCPVGFVGAAESKAALMDTLPAPAIVVDGRLGGSAITVAAINALASREEI